jgi:hypothetical protein
MEIFTSRFSKLVNESNMLNYIKNNYDKGIVSYTSLGSDNLINIIKHEELYVPVDFSLDLNKIQKTEHEEIVAENINALKDILKILVEKIFAIDIEQIMTTQRDNIITFSPITTQQIPLMAPNDMFTYLSSLNQINLENIYGYYAISNSELTLYAIDKLISENIFAKEDINIKNFDYLYLIKRENRDTLSLNELIDTITEEIDNLENKGIMSLNLSHIKNIEYLEQLCELFHIHIIDRYINMYILRINKDFYKFSSVSPKEWIINSLTLIKNGNYPRVNITGDWLYNYKNKDYIRLYGSNFQDVILKYNAYITYSNISDEFKLKKNYITEIQINHDLSISLYLPSYIVVKKFKKILKQNLKNIYDISALKSQNDLIEGIIKRYIVQKIDPEALPMIIQNLDQKEFLIYRSPLSIPVNNPFDFSSKNLDKEKENFIGDLRKYYSSLCHDNIEPVLLENIKEMDLNQLLNLIPLKENRITYCFLKDTLFKTNFNPITKSPFSEKTLFQLENNELAWRGLFDIAILFGLEENGENGENEEREFKNINVEMLEKYEIKIRRKELNNDKMRELLGNVFIVEIISPNKNIIPLFEISLPTTNLKNIDILKENVETLWDKGFFLSDWNIFFLKNTNNIPKFIPINITDRILLNAKDSIYDGLVALEYLKRNF